MYDSAPSRTLTFLFTDLESSTHLWQQFPEAMRTAQARHDALLKEAVGAHRGRIVKTTGDGLHAVFESAEEAVAAALAGQQAMIAERWPEGVGPLRVRMGVHTGESEERAGDFYGSEVNRAARLMSIGHGGQVLLSSATAMIVRDRLPADASILELGEHRLRDLEHPEYVYQLAHPDLPSEFGPLRSPSEAKHNLPEQLTTFVGRMKELAEVADLLDRSRLLTLIGPGGTGKTRLSLQAAAQSLHAYEDGVFFVDLTLLSDPSQIMGTIAETLGVRELSTEPVIDTLKRYLKDRQLLLVLDNFEHLIKGSSGLGDLIRAAPDVDLLVTSREVLRVSGENTYRVPPLDLPDPDRKVEVSDLAQYEAVELFVKRAQAAHHGFELTDQNSTEVAEICRRLDGLPLAIELAAARTRMFPPKKLLEGLSDRLKLLSGGMRDLPSRQQTLRSTIDWSYELLDESERALFARLAVFSGGGSLDAIEAVCGSHPGMDILENLESLLDKSLIRQEYDFEGQPRFTMLETIHAFAQEKLMDRDDWAATQTAHAEWVLQFAERAEAGLFGRNSETWTERVRTEEGNMRVALERCRSGKLDPELGVHLAGKLRYYWESTDKLTEGRAWLDSMLSISTEASAEARASAICGAGVLAYWQGDWSNCGKWCREALEVGRELGDQFVVGEAQHFLAHYSQNEGELDRAVDLLRESLDNFLELDHSWGILRSRVCLADAERLTQNYERAARNFREIIQEYENRTKDLLYAASMSNYGNVLNRQGEYERALASFRKGIEFASELENATLLGFLFDGLAGTAILTSQPERSAQLMGASQMAFERAGVTSLNAVDQFDHDHYMAAIREKLDDDLLDDLIETGRQMSLEQAVTFALETDHNS